MPEKESPSSDDSTPLEPRTLKLPAKPTFEREPRVKEEEHQRRPKPKGPYRPIKDLGKPTFVQEPDNDSPSPKR